MSCNRTLQIELTCEQVAGVIHALGPHSGAEMNVVRGILEEALKDHEHEE